MREQKITTADKQCWMAKLLGFHWDIDYKSRKHNSAAYALSEVQEEADLQFIISASTKLQGRDIYEEIWKNPELMNYSKKI